MTEIAEPTQDRVVRGSAAAEALPYASIRLDPKQWGDPRWRLSNLYWIVDEQGKEVKFRPNDIQLRLLDDLHELNCVLKSRQHGLTTLAVLIVLDQCVWRENITAGIIAHTVGDAKKIFRTKVQHPYTKLPALVRDANPLVNDSQAEFVFANGSSISVGTSMRSGTLQFLLISEFGKLSRKYPDKAIEIVTGSFNTVHPGQFIFVESTAEGRGGAFYELVQRAKALRDKGAFLTQLDFKYHFYAWWEKLGNRLDPEGVVIDREMAEYFDELDAKHGIKLDERQKAWYVKKREQMLVAGGSGAIDGDLLMKREHPSFDEEAFQAAAEAAYYAREMVWLRKNGRIRSLPILNVPVYTFWDIGRKDRTSIWFLQKVGPENRFIDFYENSGEGVPHYVRKLIEHAQASGYVYGQHYLPHDAENKHMESDKSVIDRLWDLGVRNVTVVERVENLGFGIEAVRQVIPTCWFDEVRCAPGLTHLENYRKSWNDTVGDWHDYPVDDQSVHAADAFRQFAQSGLALKPGHSQVAGNEDRRSKTKRKRSWRVA